MMPAHRAAMYLPPLRKGARGRAAVDAGFSRGKGAIRLCAWVKANPPAARFATDGPLLQRGRKP